MQDTDSLIRGAQCKVSSTITALESAIASYDAMQQKPERYADTIQSMRRLLSRLEEWERRSLRNCRAPDETRKKDMEELMRIADSSKGDF